MAAYFEVKNVIKHYPQKQNKIVKALDGISFNIEKGEIFSILGPNGAGKTTLINIMNGLLYPDAGDVLYDGKPILDQYTQFLSKIGAVLEGNRNIYWYMSAVDNLKYFGRLQFIPEKELARRAHELLDFFDLKEMKEEKVGKFSRGMQQKVAICVALINHPEILFLDEPTLGLDVVTKEHLLERLKYVSAEDKTSIVLTTHNLDVVERISSRVLILNKGKMLHLERLDALKNLFSEKSFSIQLHNILTDTEKKNIEELSGTENPVKFTERDSEMTVLKVSTTSKGYEDTLKKMLSLLLESGKHVVSFAAEEPSLEKVFLKIFSGGENK